MSPLTHQNIGRHELIGLHVVVEKERHFRDSTIKGKVIDETRNMIVVFDGVKKRRIAKVGSTFHFTLPDDSTIIIEGEVIRGRPEDRIKTFRRKQN